MKRILCSALLVAAATPPVGLRASCAELDGGAKVTPLITKLPEFPARKGVLSRIRPGGSSLSTGTMPAFVYVLEGLRIQVNDGTR